MADVITGSAKIRFSPKILRRLGEELNPSTDQGIIELVKNAYDANALVCEVWLDSHPEFPEAIVIEDDGDGMDGSAIINGWLVLGGSSKESSGLTRLNRTTAGNKGLGRLAALRLGRFARLSSRPGDGFEYQVELDWDLFDNATAVDDVALVVARQPTTAPPGTRIVLSNLRNDVGRVAARSLARAMVMLADPFGESETSFTALLHSKEYEDLAAQVASKYFDQADVVLEATLVGGKGSINVKDWRGEIVWTTELPSSPDAAPYGAPDCTFRLWAFTLSAKEFLNRPIPLKAVREWLAVFGGVHIYVNGLRVAPYGDPGNDWLDMNLARVRSPEVRPSTNTAIGRVSVVDADDVLKQKTDRSGFLESAAFDELRRFATDALNWMAQRRIEEAERKRQATRRKTTVIAVESGASVQQSIERVRDSGTKAELRQAFEKYEQDRNREADTLRREVQLYRTLSTAGITAATFAHESRGNPLKVIDSTINGIDRRLRMIKDLDFSQYGIALERIRAATRSLGVLSTATLGLVKSEKRRQSKVHLDDVIREVCATFAPFFAGRKVELRLEIGDHGSPYVTGSVAALESIITNLINNALEAFERSASTERILRVRTSLEGTNWLLEVADNGPGIRDLSLTEIWLPGNTVREQGTGLGLTIVRDSVVDLGGRAAAEATGDLGGAVFSISLPTTGVDDAPLF